jgi:hypothetical protein
MSPSAIQQLINRTCSTAAKHRALQTKLGRILVERYGALPDCRMFVDGTDLGILGLDLGELDLAMAELGYPVNCVAPGVRRYNNHRKVARPRMIRH